MAVQPPTPSQAPLNRPATFQTPTVAQVALNGAVKGTYTGLVLGILWGCWEEKKFVLRNCLKEYHLRECPTRLFHIMQRSVTTAPIVATFMGVHAGLRCWWHRQQQRQDSLQGWQQLQIPNVLSQQPGNYIPAHQPVLAGAAGTAAGAVRTLLSEAALAMHPLLHAQRSLVAGLAAAGLFAFGGFLEQEREQLQLDRQQRLLQMQQEEHWEQQQHLPDSD